MLFVVAEMCDANETVITTYDKYCPQDPNGMYVKNGYSSYEGCHCKEGYLRDPNTNRCIAPEDCPGKDNKCL